MGASSDFISQLCNWLGWRELSLSVSPPARAYHGMVSTAHGVVLFGGRTFHLDVYDKSFDDVWLFDGTQWTNITFDVKAAQQRV